jgi:hypothetical protein
LLYSIDEEDALRAAASISSVGSTPRARAPRPFSQRVQRPKPQPTSSARTPSKLLASRTLVTDAHCSPAKKRLSQAGAPG